MISCEKIINKLLENLDDIDWKIMELALQDAIESDKIKKRQN